MTYVLYATTNDGDGYVEQIGEYDSPEEIRIRTGMFSKDVVITIEEPTEQLKKLDEVCTDTCE